MISVAMCSKCGEIEPQDHDYEREGLWICGCPQSRTQPKKLDEFVEKFFQRQLEAFNNRRNNERKDC